MTASTLIRTRNHSGLPAVHRWTRDEYRAVALAGVFDDQRVELINGEIIDMAPMLSPHATAIRNVSEFFYVRAVGRGVVVGSQVPIWMDEHSEPEPDLYLARGASNDYANEHPGPDDLLLVLEVADSTLVDDRKQKGSLYARAGISEYWLLNIPQRQLEIYRQPQVDPEASFGHSYALHLIVPEAESASPQALPDLVMVPAAVLPPAPSP